MTKSEGIIKMTMVDGTVIECTVEEIRDMIEIFDEIECSKEETKAETKAEDKPEHRYKRGDFVQVLEGSPFSMFDAGDYATVWSNKDYNGSAGVERTDGTGAGFIKLCDLKPVDGSEIFKNGDVVVIINNSTHSRNEIGDIGIIENGSDVQVEKRDVPGANGNETVFSDIRHATKEEIEKYEKEVTESKIEVGQYAKIVGPTYNSNIEEGDFVEIVSYADDEGDFKVAMLDGSNNDYANLSSLEIVEYKDTFTEGTFVKIIGNDNESINEVGDVGVVGDYHVNELAVDVKVRGRVGGNNTRYSDMRHATNEEKHYEELVLEAEKLKQGVINVGDFVKVTGITHCNDIKLGEIALVVGDLDYDGDLRIRTLDGSDLDFVKPHKLEKLEPKDAYKEGDVVFIMSNGSRSVNRVGDVGIVRMRNKDERNVAVKVDGRSGAGNYLRYSDIRHATKSEIEEYEDSKSKTVEYEDIEVGDVIRMKLGHSEFGVEGGELAVVEIVGYSRISVNGGYQYKKSGESFEVIAKAITKTDK